MFRAVLAAVAGALVVPVSAQAALSFAFAQTQARVGRLPGTPWSAKPGRVLKVRR